jgi:hypothetical protein
VNQGGTESAHAGRHGHRDVVAARRWRERWGRGQSVRRLDLSRARSGISGVSCGPVRFSCEKSVQPTGGPSSARALRVANKATL